MPVRIEGIVTDEMYVFLKQGFANKEYYVENNVEFTRVGFFTKNADIRIISAEMLLERNTVEGIPDGTLLIENADIIDNLESIFNKLNKNLLPNGKFQWVPLIFSELPDCIRRINK